MLRQWSKAKGTKVHARTVTNSKLAEALVDNPAARLDLGVVDEGAVAWFVRVAVSDGWGVVSDDPGVGEPSAGFVVWIEIGPGEDVYIGTFSSDFSLYRYQYSPSSPRYLPGM